MATTETLNKLTRLKHLVDLGNRTKTELDALDAQIQELVTVGGEPNVIEEIQVNGVKQAVSNKIVNILMATKVSALTNDADYQTGAEVASAIQAAIAATGHAHFETAASVPSASAAKDNVLYLVMNSKTNHYDIYAKVGGEVVRIDDTTVDLSAYSTTEQVNALISAAISALKIGDYAKAADLTAAVGRISAVEGKLNGISTTVVDYVTSAISALKIGDYAKASTVTALAERVTTLEGKAHQHSNKSLLDTYTQTEANLADAVSKKHSHSNKTVLDGITAQNITDWNDAVSKEHEHSNKTVLDGITSAKVNAWNAAEQNAKNYADGLASNYDAAGAAATAESNAKAYVDNMIASDAEVTSALNTVFGA